MLDDSKLAFENRGQNLDYIEFKQYALVFFS